MADEKQGSAELTGGSAEGRRRAHALLELEFGKT